MPEPETPTIQAGLMQALCTRCGGYTEPIPTLGPFPTRPAADHKYVEGCWVHTGLMCPDCQAKDEE